MGAGDSFATAMLITILKKLETQPEGSWKNSEIRAEILPEALKAAAVFSAGTCLKNGAFGDGVPVPKSEHDRIYRELSKQK